MFYVSINVFSVPRYFKLSEVNFSRNRGYLKLDLCVEIGSWMVYCLRLLCNAYLTFFYFSNTKGSTRVTHKGTRGYKYKGKVYLKYSGKCQIHSWITIRAIGGWEVQFDFHCAKYRKSLKLNFGMLLLCLTKESFLRLFYASWFIFCFSNEALLRYYYTSTRKHIFNRIVILFFF